MPQIDWSKAPEGATHKVPTGCWYKIDGYKVYCWCSDYWSGPYSIQQYQDGSIEQMVERPSDWNGQGLPPVGTVCEAKIDYSKAPPYAIMNLVEIGIDVTKETKFRKVTVLYSSEKYSIVDSFGYECIVPICCAEFRPIKTQAQIEAEAREADIAMYMADLCISEKLATVMYNKGYRLTKQERE